VPSFCARLLAALAVLVEVSVAAPPDRVPTRPASAKAVTWPDGKSGWGLGGLAGLLDGAWLGPRLGVDLAMGLALAA